MDNTSVPNGTSNVGDLNQQSAVNNTQNQVGNISNAGDPLLTDKVHPDDLDKRWVSWKCMVCSYVYEGVRPKNVCPKCGNDDPDKFD